MIKQIRLPLETRLSDFVNHWAYDYRPNWTPLSFEGLKLLHFLLFEQAFDSTLLKNHAKFKIEAELLKRP